MDDEFIEDDFLEEDEGTAGSNRPFLLAVGALVTVFILAAACTLLVLNRGRDAAGNAAEIAAVETANAEIFVTNTAVAIFISQTETAQAMPTNTPPPTATNTSTPAPAAETAEPTRTPVLGSAGEGDETEEGDGEGGEITSGEGVTGTIVIGGDGSAADGEGAADNGGRNDGEASTVGDGGTGDSVVSGAATAISGTESSTSALPQTGLETWVIALVGLLLVAVLVAAHRLRTQ